MNHWTLLATVHDYPRTISKEPLEIRLKAINARHANIVGEKPHKLSTEIPLFARGGVARGLMAMFKKTRFICLEGYIELAGNGTIKLWISQYTALPGQQQQAKEYIEELMARDELVKSIDLPVYDLTAGQGEITPSDPDKSQDISWKI